MRENPKEKVIIIFERKPIKRNMREKSAVMYSSKAICVNLLPGFYVNYTNVSLAKNWSCRVEKKNYVRGTFMIYQYFHNVLIFLYIES